MKNKQTRKEEALERSKVHNSLSTKQKILKLDMRFGAGQGAKKERSKLAKKLEIETQTGAIPQSVGFTPQKPKKKPYQKPKRS